MNVFILLEVHHVLCISYVIEFWLGGGGVIQNYGPYVCFALAIVGLKLNYLAAYVPHP